MPITNTHAGKRSVRKVVMRTALALLAAATTAPSGALAGETEVKAMLKAMTDFMATQKEVSFRFDASIEAVTKDGEKLRLPIPGGWRSPAPTESPPRGRRLCRYGDDLRWQDDDDPRKDQEHLRAGAISGTVDHLVDVLQNQYNRPLPAADLLLTNAYSELMTDVTEAKDLGSGVIGGTECDHLAFRAKEVDWQIWIAQGNRPFPCKYVITSKLVPGYPAYTIQFADWQSGSAAVEGAFVVKAPAGAKQVSLEELKSIKDMNEFPSNFILGGKQ